MTRLSVNINKIATLRNARGGNVPNVLETAIRCEEYGAQGITVHPRPDERHIRYQDVWDIKPIVKTEFNIEGYPSPAFMKLVLAVSPHQVTLVPDPPGALTSSEGWDTRQHLVFLQKTVAGLQEAGIRTSLFIDTEEEHIRFAAKTGTNRVELYTEPFASGYEKDPGLAVAPFRAAAQLAGTLGLEVNAGHDLSLQNLNFFYRNVQELKEVSIGHALIADALHYGLENSIQLYLRQLQ